MTNTEPFKTLDIRDVWQALGFELRGNGNVKCFSPAHKHGDRNPSLGLNRRTNRYKCFTCGVQGDQIELVQQVQGCDFRQATEWLAQAFNIPLDSVGSRTSPDSGLNGKRYIDRQTPPQRRPNEALEPLRLDQAFNYQLPEHIDVYRAFYNHTEAPSDQLVKWWTDRGLSLDLLQRAGWRTITRKTWQAMADQYSREQLAEAGLLTERGGRLYPLFYNHSVVVPFYDMDQLAYIRGRSLDPNVRAKYLAPKGTSPIIYNYQTIVDLTDGDPIYITESETDALALTEQGYVALALVGGQKHPKSLVVRELAHIIVEGFSTAQRVQIAVDRDDTGTNFFNAVAKALYIAGIPADQIVKYQCKHPEHKDAAECLQASTQYGHLKSKAQYEPLNQTERPERIQQ